MLLFATVASAPQHENFSLSNWNRRAISSVVAGERQIAYMEALVTQIIGAVAATASTASFAPQAWKIIWTRDVEGLSGGMYMLTVAAFGLWLTYGILKQDWALMIPNSLCLCMSAFILAMIVVSRRTRNRVANAIEHGLQKGAQVTHAE